MTAARALPLLFLLALGAPAARAEPSDAEAACRRVRALLDELGRVGRAAPPRLAERLDEACQAFVDAHLVDASPDALTLVGTAWLQLARQRGDLDAVRLRLDRLDARRPLPLDLRRRVRLERGRLAVVPGAPAPRWSAPRVADGQPFDAQRLRGKLLLIHFWDPLSPSCRDYVQRKLIPLRGRTAELEVVALATAPAGLADDELARRAAAEGITWTLLRDTDGALALDHGATTAPFVCLIDRTGTVLAAGPGWQVHGEVAAAVTKALAPAGDAPGEGQ